MNVEKYIGENVTATALYGELHYQVSGKLAASDDIGLEFENAKLWIRPTRQTGRDNFYIAMHSDSPVSSGRISLLKSGLVSICAKD